MLFFRGAFFGGDGFDGADVRYGSDQSRNLGLLSD
jgi:hypothetical protein